MPNTEKKPIIGNISEKLGKLNGRTKLMLVIAGVLFIAGNAIYQAKLQTDNNANQKALSGITKLPENGRSLVNDRISDCLTISIPGTPGLYELTVNLPDGTRIGSDNGQLFAPINSGPVDVKFNLRNEEGSNLSMLIESADSGNGKDIAKFKVCGDIKVNRYNIPILGNQVKQSEDPDCKVLPGISGQVILRDSKTGNEVGDFPIGADSGVSGKYKIPGYSGSLIGSDIIECSK